MRDKHTSVKLLGKCAWQVVVQSLSHVRLFGTPQTVHDEYFRAILHFVKFLFDPLCSHLLQHFSLHMLLCLHLSHNNEVPQVEFSYSLLLHFQCRHVPGTFIYSSDIHCVPSVCQALCQHLLNQGRQRRCESCPQRHDDWWERWDHKPVITHIHRVTYTHNYHILERVLWRKVKGHWAYLVAQW